MVPLGTVARVEHATGPLMVMRYNMYASAAVNGVPAPGVSSGTVVKAADAPGERAGRPVRVDRDDVSAGPGRQRRPLIFALGTVLVYLVLAAKYESWRLPLAVILVVPMCMLAAVTGMTIARCRWTSSCRSAFWCWSAWPARTPS